jgi:hypothetical protein
MLGVALPVALAGVIVTLLGAHSARRLPTSPPPAAAAITGPQVASLRFVRGVTGRQLREFRHRLGSCPHRRAGPAWRRCAKWPIANLTVATRIDATLFASLARDLPVGRCRGLAMGSGNMARILSGEADQLVRSLTDASPAGSARSADGYQVVRGLIADVLAVTHQSGWHACVATAWQPRIA